MRRRARSDLLAGEWFYHVGARAEIDRGGRGLQRSISGNHESFDESILTLGRAQDIDSAHIRKLQVEHENIVGGLPYRLKGLFAGGTHVYLEPTVKGFGEKITQRLFVVNDQYTMPHRRHRIGLIVYHPDRTPG